LYLIGVTAHAVHRAAVEAAAAALVIAAAAKRSTAAAAKRASTVVVRHYTITFQQSSIDIDRSIDQRQVT
jgi:hypothetical protein